MGSAALYQLARAGKQVLGIDQYLPPHSYGSSHGETRITRKAIGEGEHYTFLSLRSYELWRQIEEETGSDLLTITGGLMLSSQARTGIMHVAEFFANTLSAAEKHGIHHDVLDAADIRRRFPQFCVQDDEVGYYEYDAGFLRPEACISAQLALAKKYGAQTVFNESVSGFDGRDPVCVTTGSSTYCADKLIITAGPWLPQLLPAEKDFLKVFRQTLYWFKVKDNLADYQTGKFPIFIWELQGRRCGIYGFPSLDGQTGSLKIAAEDYAVTITPELVDRSVSTDEITTMYEMFVKPYFPGISSECIKTAVCMYTVTPDFGFIIDRHPDNDDIIIASCCSGHGFKHSAAIGEALAQLSGDGTSTIDVSKFALARFRSGSPSLHSV
jgi:sarcosine oxidase